jgi:hypothetical protein
MIADTDRVAKAGEDIWTDDRIVSHINETDRPGGAQGETYYGVMTPKHEVAHVVQQKGESPQTTTPVEMSRPLAATGHEPDYRSASSTIESAKRDSVAKIELLKREHPDWFK